MRIRLLLSLSLLLGVLLAAQAPPPIVLLPGQSVTITAPPAPVPVPVPTPPGDLTQLPLVQAATLHWAGAFAFPSYGGGLPTPGYGNGGVAYRKGVTAADDSLYVQLFSADPAVWMSLAREMSIPAGVSQTDAYANAGVWRQPAGDIYGGQFFQQWDQSGDLLVYHDRVVASAFTYYDAGLGTKKSHVSSPLTLGQAVRGPTLVDPVGLPPGTNWSPLAVKAGWTGGWMGDIPTAWQMVLGGPAFTGQCCLSIISRTSSGPSLTVFDPDQIGTQDPLPGTLLLGYPDDFYENHTTGLGQFATEHWFGEHGGINKSYFWGSNHFNGSTRIAGAVFVPGTRSILFFGKQGTGPFCYGDSNPDPTLFHTKPAPFNDPMGVLRGGEMVCKTGPYEGHHTWAEPYRYQVWAYDALDLIPVKQGTKKPWEVLPYAVWELHVPLAPPAGLDQGFGFRGATVNTRTGELYVWQLNGAYPFVNVYRVGP